MNNKTLAGMIIAGTVAFSGAAGAQERPDWFQRRLEMIEALEVTKDDARLQALVAEDAGNEYPLGEYYRVLIRAASSLKDPALVKKLLDLPVLDRQSPDYVRVVENAYSYFAGNGMDDIPPEIMTRLLDVFDHDLAAVNRSLSFMFSNAARPFYPLDAGIAKKLVALGGDAGAAALAAENEARAKEAERPAILDRDLAKIREFKEAVLAP